MSRVIEGTTLGGFTCDANGCDRVAVYAPVVCVPYEGFPVQVRKPIIGFIDTHVCPLHWRSIRGYDVLGKKIRDAIEAVAVEHNGRPAFRRAYVKPIRCHSAEFLQFQQKSGLVAPDDALAKPGQLAMP